MSNEWYTKHSKDVAAALNKGRTATPEDAVACTLVKMPDGAYLLCANVSAPKAAGLVKDAKTNGGKVVSAGTLYKGPDGVTFAVSQGSIAVAKQFSEAAAASGKPMHVIVIAAPGLIPLDAPAPGIGAPPAPPPPPGQAAPVGDGAAAQFKTRITRLVPAVKQAPVAVQATVQPLLLQAVTLGKAARYAEAAPLLDQVEKGLSAAPASALPPKAPPAPAPAADLAEAFRTRVKGLTTGLMAADASVQAALKPRLVQALALGKTNRFAEADPLLNEVEKGLTGKAAPPAAAPPPPPASTAPLQTAGPQAAPPPAAPPISDKVQMTERLKGIKPRYAAALQTNPPNKAVLEKAMGMGVQAAKAGDFARGLKILDGLEKALPPSAMDAAKLAESRDRWLDAREEVGKGIVKLQAFLRNHPDPRAEPIAEMGLNGVTGKLQVGLEVALLECQSNPNARPRAREAIAKFRQFLASDPRVDLCDANPWNIAVGLRDTLLPALDDLDKALAG